MNCAVQNVIDMVHPAARPFIGTYTALHTFKNICEHQAYRRFVLKDIRFTPTSASEFGTRVHEAMAARLAAKTPLPPDFRQWEGFAHPFEHYDIRTERKLGMTADGKATGYFADDVSFRGQADLIVRQNAKAYIIDWKTGNSKYEDPFELQTNALLVHVHFPNIKQIVGSYAWLKENRMSQVYDCSDFNTTFLEIKRLMDLIAEKRQTGDFVKRKSGLCGHCPVEDCENWYEAKK
jgi:hypothetical protein